MGQFLRLFALPLVLLPCFAACGTPSAGASTEDPEAVLARQMAEEGIYPESRPTRITFKDHRSGVTIGLLNRALTDTSNFYSEVRAQMVYKVIPDLDMGALLRQLEDYEFFPNAMPSEARVPGARCTVQVERGGQVFTMAYTTVSPQEVVERVQHCSAAIQYVYNKHHAFQVVDNQVGENYFQDSNQKHQTPRGSR